MSLSIPDSYDTAYKRRIWIERKIKSDPVFIVKYTEEIAKYLRCGYARQLSLVDVSKRSNINWY